MNLIMIAGLGIGLIVAGVIAGMGVIYSGFTGSMATNTKSIIPTGVIKGNALVVYDPGVTRAAKNAAGKIANSLKSNDYKVELAGVSSASASNTSSHDVIIAGGPMYYGKVSNSIDKYLKALNIRKSVKIGVFGTTGSSEFHDEDIKSFGKQVTSNLNREAVIKTLRNGNSTSIDCTDFVSTLLNRR
jgi:flavodoxin